MTDERMPDATVYEQELKYMPYAKSLRKVIDIVCSKTPQNGKLVDLMCGTGYLLGKVNERRKDITLFGVDIDPRYVRFSQEQHPGIAFETGDVLTWTPSDSFDVFMCTGALHHVHYDKQEEAVRRMAGMINPGGFGIISDCYVGNYSNELERKLAAAKLGYEYLIETMRNGSPDDVTAVTADILKNDVIGIEFKTSLARRLPIFRKFFGKVKTFKTWPHEPTDYGDYVTVLRNPKNIRE